MEQDLDIAAKAILVQKHIDKMLSILDHAKAIRKSLGEIDKDVFKEAHSIPGLDEVSVAMGFAKVSDHFLNSFETALYEISEVASAQANELIESKYVGILEAFAVVLTQLKPRSLRHLENFLSAATDNEWVDGLFVAKGNDSEFRCIDRCSSEAKKEFGIEEKK